MRYINSIFLAKKVMYGINTLQ